MAVSIPPRLLDGLSIYQDVVLAGETACVGTRDCEARWRLLDPHLPRAGAILDVGSNFGWFGLRIAQTRPECVVASAEADYRSARVQREVLASHFPPPAEVTRGPAARVCLLTRRLNGSSLKAFIAARQRFDAALCLNVLHWIRDHRAFLQALGATSARIFVEHPDPDEVGAGIEHTRREIGPIGAYLADVFPHRSVVCLGALPSHRERDAMRTLWLVEPPRHWSGEPSPGLEVEGLWNLAPRWPGREWWLRELFAAAQENHPVEREARSSLRLTSHGLRLAGNETDRLFEHWQAEFAKLPDSIEPRWPQRARAMLRRIAQLARLG